MDLLHLVKKRGGGRGPAQASRAQLRSGLQPLDEFIQARSSLKARASEMPAVRTGWTAKLQR